MKTKFWYKVKYFQRWFYWKFTSSCPNCLGHKPSVDTCDVCEGEYRHTLEGSKGYPYWWNRFLNKLGWKGLRIGRFLEAKIEQPALIHKKH